MIQKVNAYFKYDEPEDIERLQALINDAVFEIKHSTGLEFKQEEADDYQIQTVVMLVKLSSGEFDDDSKASEVISKSIKGRLFKIAHCYGSEV